MSEEEEEKLFRLLQFLSFIKSLELNPFKDCKRLRVRRENYYILQISFKQICKIYGD